MSYTIMKFGGTSLKDEQSRFAAYKQIARGLQKGKVLVVVSAMGRYPMPYATDTLLSLGHPLLSKEQQASLVSMGEQLSALVVCAELLKKGISVTTIPYHQAGIIVDEEQQPSSFQLDDRYIKQAFSQYDVVVVAGFIAYTKEAKITTLGRGGSDLSAVLFADMLKEDEVSIYTDVNGVYQQDPKQNQQAKKYDRLTYDELLSMHAFVVQPNCVEYAKEHRIRILVKGTFSDEEGTIITT